jgi:ABC-2 type transport system permease protein
MSAAEAAGTAVAAGVRPVIRPVSTRLLRSELWLIFGRRRNWVGMATLATLPLIIAIATRVSGPGSDPAEGPTFFSEITNNGFFVSLAALTAELPLFLPIAVASIAGDSIAGEANLGTLRYLLAVPVDRIRLLAVKYTAVVIFTFTATAFVAVVGLLAGLALFGGGPVTLLSGSQVSFGEGLLRLAGVCAYIAVGLCALGAIGLFASTLTEQPLGAAIAVAILSVVSFILDSVPQLGWLHPYLLTHWWMAFGDLLRDPVATADIRTGLLSAGAYILVFVLAAWARFAGRDVTS